MTSKIYTVFGVCQYSEGGHPEICQLLAFHNEEDAKNMVEQHNRMKSNMKYFYTDTILHTLTKEDSTQYTMSPRMVSRLAKKAYEETHVLEYVSSSPTSWRSEILGPNSFGAWKRDNPGVEFRVVAYNGEHFIITCDIRSERANLYLKGPELDYNYSGFPEEAIVVNVTYG